MIRRDRRRDGGALPEPRPHHYRFAHRLLPSLTHLDAVPPAQLDTELQRLWEEYASHFPAEQRLPVDGLHGSLVRAGQYGLVLVVLPAPRAAGEAFALVMAHRADGSAPRCFTLDYAVDPLTGEPGAVLGEWADGAHLLRRSGLTADPRPFLRAVTALLKAAESPEPPAETRWRVPWSRG
ncbi:hypothetical protein [Streptacidiphilus jiangxiensis]|uniref:Uncharacterized protein n=1 Tax=Streptacidiphilus jiangxiensis TaxID=235985 RepID=A0A1H7UWQ1_STRJI|nr:hypothetical protein [Streptacidiphilus jiangxiensis]SEM01068.1 hypothetical protein SAMN05414137_116204 [Streptacidiphilus jiangxiensis]